VNAKNVVDSFGRDGVIDSSVGLASTLKIFLLFKHLVMVERREHCLKEAKDQLRTVGVVAGAQG
jgi:hypothetical protein